jgi:hypothetical protein
MDTTTKNKDMDEQPPQYTTNANTGQIQVLWANHSVQFDGESPGNDQMLTVTILQHMLTMHGNIVHVRWNRAPSRTVLHLVYDTLATVPDINVNPSKAEALDAYAAPHTGGDSDVMVVTQPDSIVSTLHANQPPRPMESLNDLVWRIHSIDELVLLTPNDVMINHVWALRTMLGFPEARFDAEHVYIASELVRLVANIEPKAFIRSYALGEASAVPLLMWFRSNEETVLSILQEYMHLCHPCCRVWHWQLVPTDMTVSLVQKGFSSANILPSFNGIFSSIVHPPTKPPSFASIEIAANRLIGDPLRLLTYMIYDNASGVMWLDEEVFFFVMEDDSDIDDHHHLPPVRAPMNANELPRWVSQLLEDVVPQSHRIDDSLNLFLNLFIGSNPTASTQLLRRINWAMLPLYWTPVFLKSIPRRVRDSESLTSQHKLIELMGQDATPETKRDALFVIQSITGCSRKRPFPVTNAEPQE